MAEAIEFGREALVPLVPAPGPGAPPTAAADRELLEDATALLAYDDPTTSPTGALATAGRAAAAAAAPAAELAVAACKGGVWGGLLLPVGRRSLAASGCRSLC